MHQLDKARRCHIAAPAGQIMVGAVAVPVPALVVVASWVGTEQYPIGFQRGVQFRQDTGQRLAWDMKQGGIGEHPVKVTRWQFKREEILLPDLAATVGARHVSKTRTALQPHRDMPLLPEDLEIAARPAAKVQ